jgi:hypothetical protein
LVFIDSFLPYRSLKRERRIVSRRAGKNHAPAPQPTLWVGNNHGAALIEVEVTE